MYRFPWYLTLVSTNHASSNPGHIAKLSVFCLLNCAHLLNISSTSCVLSPELYDIHCIDNIHSKQLCFVLFIRFYVGQL